MAALCYYFDCRLPIYMFSSFILMVFLFSLMLVASVTGVQVDFHRMSNGFLYLCLHLTHFISKMPRTLALNYACFLPCRTR